MTRAEARGYDWTSVSENVAAGQPIPDSVMVAWMRSEGHRANILDPTARHVGVGYASNSDDEYRHYWTTLFGTTKGEPQAPLGGCHP